MEMIIVHLADTHLGCIGTGWQRTVPDPFAPHLLLRQQEADIKSGFAEAIDRILTIKPDIVIHTGDLFDSAHPTPHTMQFAFSQIQKLSTNGIPVILLEGDHSAPRVPAQGEALRILGNLPEVYVVCGEHYQKLNIKNAIIHALPHRALLGETEKLHLNDGDIIKSSNLQILIAHGVADGLPFYQTHRAGAVVPVRNCASSFEYVALGHCHRFCQVIGTDRAFYSGSSAMALSSDFRPGVDYSFNRVVVHKGLSPVVHREVLKTRSMRAYGLSDASSYSANDIMMFLGRQVEAVFPGDSYCRVVINDIHPSVRSQLVLREIERLFPIEEIAGLVIQLHVCFPSQSERGIATGQTPRERFLERLQKEEISDSMREQINSLGNTFFEQADDQLRVEDQEAK